MRQIRNIKQEIGGLSLHKQFRALFVKWHITNVTHVSYPLEKESHLYCNTKCEWISIRKYVTQYDVKHADLVNTQ